MDIPRFKKRNRNLSENRDHYINGVYIRMCIMVSGEKKKALKARIEFCKKSKELCLVCVRFNYVT